MFEEICLVCGKHLQDDGRAYCSDECQSLDANSPCISSASSTYSSPHLQAAIGGEVPPLVPSIMGSALRSRSGRDRYSISSSSASSTSWSVLSDEEDDGAVLGVDEELTYLDGSEFSYEGISKSANLLHSMRPSVLSYARRPSGTNNRSMVPLLHKSTSSAPSPSKHVCGIPRSVPIHSFPSSGGEDEDSGPDFRFPPRDKRTQRVAKRSQPKEKDSTITAKPKRTRNRGSLPAYFSLLQSIGTPQRSSPVSSSSCHTVARYSPPTPKSMFSGLAATMPQTSSATPLLLATPRGRRKEPGTSRASRRSQHSHSRSRSRSRNPSQAQRPLPQSRIHLGSRSSIEHVFDWQTSIARDRGRASIRQGSSPAKVSSTVESKADSFSARGNSRGRVDAGWTPDAPGYGIGRSGLMKRERNATSRGAAGL